jgi:hypothetical protein
MLPEWRLSEAGPDNLGLACTDDGLLLGCTSLIERRDGRFVVRARKEIERLLRRAYLNEPPVDRLMSGLGTVAAALNANDPCLARIAAVHLRVPDLPDRSVRSDLEAEDVLIKSVDWSPALHPRAGTPPNPGWFAPSGGSGKEASSTRIMQNDDPARRSDASASDSDDRVRLPAGERNDELGDLLEWIANAKPEEDRAIRAEIKRHYYDAGDKLGYEALNATLGDILEPGIDRNARQEILNQIEPYAHTEPGRGHASELLSLASLLLLGMVPPVPAVATASAAWKLGWAARGFYFSELLAADLPPTFKVIDAFSNGVVTSIKSIDLRAATYQSAVRLTYRLNEYIDKLVLFDGGTLGVFEVDSVKITGRVLSLAVPKGSMTAAQKSAIGGARARAHAFGVKLTITEF